MASTSKRLAGVASMTIDGDVWDVVGDLEYSPSTVARETLKGQTAVEGYSEMPTQGYISARLRDRADETVYSLNGKTGTTIIAQLANGKTVYGYGLWQTGEIGVNTQEATFSIKFEGASVVESTV
ncbi:MAG: phage tail tube protein [Betaproteobacteria bacterium]|nr:phage tail tube protein [Betaproteobacteria bacterium]